MRQVRGRLGLLLFGAMVWALHAPHGLVPPIGRLLDPFGGFWRNGSSAGGLVWTGAAAYFYFGGAQLIAGRIGGMFGIKPGWFMVLVTGALGALVAGAAAVCGRWVRAALAKKEA